MEASGDVGDEIGGRAVHDELIQAPTIFFQSHPSWLINAIARYDARAVRHLEVPVNVQDGSGTGRPTAAVGIRQLPRPKLACIVL